MQVENFYIRKTFEGGCKIPLKNLFNSLRSMNL